MELDETDRETSWNGSWRELEQGRTGTFRKLEWDGVDWWNRLFVWNRVDCWIERGGLTVANAAHSSYSSYSTSHSDIASNLL